MGSLRRAGSIPIDETGGTIVAKFNGKSLSGDFRRRLGRKVDHGADYGRVLAGIQVDDADYDEFLEHLAGLGYPWEDETDDPVYRLFLSERAS